MPAEPFPLNTQLLFAYDNDPLPCTVEKYQSAYVAYNCELLYALTSLYLHVLPNVPSDEIQKDLLSDASYSLCLFRSDDAVMRDYCKNPSRILRKYGHKYAEYSDYSEEDAENNADDLLKAEEFLQTKKKSQFDKYIRTKFPLLSELHKQKNSLAQLTAEGAKIRLKDRLLGALTMSYRELVDPVQGKIKVAQLLYIGVRTRFQMLKFGRRLLQTALNEAQLASYTCFFTFAGSDAVRFFRNAGLSDDPMLAGYFSQLDENWTDVVPMVRYLRAAYAVEQINGETSGNELYNKWRSHAYQLYNAESNLIGQMVLEIYRLKKKVDEFDEMQEKHEYELALEKSRCVMYEQLLQQLENQLLSAGIKPNIDQEQVMSQVLGKFGIE